MNLSHNTLNDILYVNFNQDFSCLSVGTKQGFKIFNTDPFGRCFSKMDGGIGIVEMLFNTSLVALVGAGEQPAFSPRRLQIMNTKRQSIICELNFVTSVLAVKMNRKRLLVGLEEHLHIYDISNMKLLHTIDSANKNAVCALSPSSDNCYVAYPANTTTGEVLIFDALSLKTINVIQAHKTPVSCLSFDYDGNMLATSSDKGTVIRIFNIQGDRLYQFRRGSMSASITGIMFNLQSNMLTVSSDTDTIHIYRLSNGGLNVTQYLPTVVSDMLEPMRDFAYLKLPKHGLTSIAILNGRNVMVVTSDGFLLTYSIDLENGGECVLLKQYALLESSEINK